MEIINGRSTDLDNPSVKQWGQPEVRHKRTNCKEIDTCYEDAVSLIELAQMTATGDDLRKSYTTKAIARLECVLDRLEE